MVLASTEEINEISEASNSNEAKEKPDLSNQISTDLSSVNKKRRKKKYQRKRPRSKSEESRMRMRKSRQARYEEIRKKNMANLWDFESLFPAPVWDYEIINKDLHEVSDRDAKTGNQNSIKGVRPVATSIRSPDDILAKNLSKMKPIISSNSTDGLSGFGGENAPQENSTEDGTKIDRSLTRMVEDRMYGFRRDQMGDFEYDTSLMGDGAVKFRDGVRLGNALKVNVDRLNYFAKKELAHGKLEEAEELYVQAIQLSPRDGRAYLGMSRVAQRRRDFIYAKKCLRTGINNSLVGGTPSGIDGVNVDDNGGNPFLLQALGTLEERMGHLSEAEKLYIAAARSRPSHAAAWVALAQLRTRKLRQGPNAGRMCYRTAEIELKRAGRAQSSHVYTAWAALEWKSGEIFKARKLFKKALDIDPQCSAAWNQLGVMESNEENWEEARKCFETVLKFDRRNSRVLQAYAIMETKNPDGNSRDAIGLFEKALKVKPRDGGVLQAYALYVAKLGDIDSARNLLKKGTEVDKRHSPLWQAWGVLETRHGEADDARDIFQQGIWACAQSSGGQSGGRRCARLWQAWGVLEAQEEEHTAARRCFSRALDADMRNVATVTAWTLMEEELGNYSDAKLIFERTLKQFGTGSHSEEKIAIWRAYELMEAQAGNQQAAQNVYQRSIRDAFIKTDFSEYDNESISRVVGIDLQKDELLKESGGKEQVEVSRWDSKRDEAFGESAVWIKDGSIEGKVPPKAMKKKSRQPKVD
eukprot:CAMPEP_0194087380 /NCGR_PEP_ID=MMETSP0149-20130528/24803_1 /TAXON_ID=122233 /ORGANISM="Chaetoceros debilis, Strain MM31A-1" /LENGTH=753 /DNA_ID=CAMNT_0038770711 /DNA_START=422 /DNA_END=2683 /DNA_ORIENTATION=-